MFSRLQILLRQSTVRQGRNGYRIGGFQKRNVYCPEGKKCDKNDKPVDTQNCNIKDCDNEWVVGRWRKCSKMCGGGIRYRTVVCKNTTTNQPIRSLNCHGRKPVISERCNKKACSRDEQNRNARLTSDRSLIKSGQGTQGGAAIIPP